MCPARDIHYDIGPILQDIQMAYIRIHVERLWFECFKMIESDLKMPPEHKLWVNLILRDENTCL